MASELMYVLKNKNKYEKEEKKQRQIEIENLKQDGIFRVALNNELAFISNIFEDPDVQVIQLHVDDKFLAAFGASIGYEEMKLFSFRQGKDLHTYIVTRKEI